MSIISIQPQPCPIPLDIRKQLYDYWTPWQISDGIFNEMKKQNDVPYKKVQILPTDPEWRFVWKYFYHDKPYRFGIKRIFCIFERHQQKAFEFNLSSIEREASVFRPTWNQEPRCKQRAQAIERWRNTVNLFSPFNTIETDGRHRSWKETKILPLWHGSNNQVCDSISRSGFVYFGKTSIGEQSIGEPASTDEGFFGSGIYFTNSARYAADIYSSGHILMAWVSMREPFPVVGDPKQEDMNTLKGKGAYKHYNAHYIPVCSQNPSDPDEAIYYPVEEGQSAHCDEVVVFHKSQTIPRFWLELEIEAPYVMNPSEIPQFVNELIPHLFKILENPNVDRDQKLRNYLGNELAILLKLKEDDYLEDHGNKYEVLYSQLTQLLDTQGKINRQISRAILGSISAPSLITCEMAFGKVKWEKYFGDIGIEPPLPSNIEEILNQPCPYWPEKKVKDTHILTLVPSTVNGQPLTLTNLANLILNPLNNGKSTKYNCYSSTAKQLIGNGSVSRPYWILMTKEVIPNSRSKTYQEQCSLLKEKYKVPYILESTVSILMHYVCSGERLYVDSPLTYARCHDNVLDYKDINMGTRFVVGSFGLSGFSIDYRSGLRGYDGGISAAIRFQQASSLPLPQLAFGKAKWEKYFGDVGSEPPLPNNIEEILNESCPYWSGKKVKDTHILTLIPSTINGQPLTLTTLGNIIQNPRNDGKATKYTCYTYVAKEMLGNHSISSSYWVLMTKDVLPNSRSKIYQEQCNLLKGQYKVPYVLESTIGILMHYIEHGEKLYVDNPLTYARCQDSIVEKEDVALGTRFVIGSFGSSGFSIDYRSGLRGYDGGIAAVMRFISQ